MIRQFYVRFTMAHCHRYAGGMRAMTTDDGVTPATSLALQRGLLQTDAGRVEARGERSGVISAPSGALYVGPAGGENGVDGLVLKVGGGPLQTVTTVVTDESGASTLEALTISMHDEPERWRDAPRDEAYWHSLPSELQGEVPVVEPRHGLLIVCDAGLRDQYRQSEFAWDRWVDEVVAPAAASRGLPVTAVEFAGRSEVLLALGATSFPSGAAVFAGFDANLQIAALHLSPVAEREQEAAILAVRRARAALRDGEPSRAATQAMAAISALEAERDLRAAGRVGFVLAEAHDRAGAPAAARRALEEALVRLEVARDAEGQRVALALLDGSGAEEHAG
ncbi:hypothetical protein C5C17_08765 [Pseudoclavibacter sp. RFBA6]|nr:hypothetical protein C5C17_08765 [Pseudoclavibacter sp. RFBA6]